MCLCHLPTNLPTLAQEILEWSGVTTTGWARLLCIYYDVLWSGLQTMGNHSPVVSYGYTILPTERLEPLSFMYLALQSIPTFGVLKSHCVHYLVQTPGE